MTLYPWQQSQWQQLWLQWQQRRLPHALLLSGCAGLGKSQFAALWAMRLLCQSDQSLPCGTCQSCVWVTAGSHPDLFILTPEEEGKAIKIEQVRELIQNLQQTPQQSHQVVIIQPAEAFNKAAANALLKTLEEPTGSVFFLLVSHQIQALPATIRSRCQPVGFTVPAPAISLEWLQKQLPEQTQAVAALLALADGAPLHALALAEPGRLASYQQISSGLLQVACGQCSPLALATTCLKHELAEVLLVMWGLTRDLLCLHWVQQPDLTHRQHADALSQLSPKVSVHHLFALLDKLTESQQSIESKINLNAQLLYEELFMDWREAWLASA